MMNEEEKILEHLLRSFVGEFCNAENKAKRRGEGRLRRDRLDTPGRVSSSRGALCSSKAGQTEICYGKALTSWAWMMYDPSPRIHSNGITCCRGGMRHTMEAGLPELQSPTVSADWWKLPVVADAPDPTSSIRGQQQIGPASIFFTRQLSCRAIACLLWRVRLQPFLSRHHRRDHLHPSHLQQTQMQD